MRKDWRHTVRSRTVRLMDLIPAVLLGLACLSIFLGPQWSCFQNVSRFLFRHDWLIYIALLLFYTLWWLLARSVSSTSTPESNNVARTAETATERSLGAAALRSQITVGITAASILITACILFLGYVTHGNGALQDIAGIVFRSVSWLFLSLLIALWNLAATTTRVNKVNVAKSTFYNLLASAQIWAIFFGLLSVLQLITLWGAK